MQVNPEKGYVIDKKPFKSKFFLFSIEELDFILNIDIIILVLVYLIDRPCIDRTSINCPIYEMSYL